MSVRTGDRTEGKITAVDASRLLIDYTYDRVHDKTLFKQLERSGKNGNDAGKTSQD